MPKKFDRKGKRARWEQARRAESSYSIRLRQVAKQVGAIIKGFTVSGVVTNKEAMLKALEDYSRLIGPWARSVAEYMVADVARRNAKAWKEQGAEMGQALRAEIAQAPTGRIFSDLMDKQVTLITSLPLEAAERVQRLSTEAMSTGARPAEIMAEIMRIGEVTESRAKLIARTEVSRAQTNLTEARALYVGSEGYVWRTSNDGNVRDTHRAMNGKFVRWDSPPKTDPNLDPYHAGAGPNCRCYCDPIF